MRVRLDGERPELITSFTVAATGKPQLSFDVAVGGSKISGNMYVCMYVYIHVCMFVCMYVSFDVAVGGSKKSGNMYVCMYVCIEMP